VAFSHSRAIPDKPFVANLLYAPHGNATHSTADNQDPTNHLTYNNYECLSDVVPAPELVGVSGGNVFANNDVIIDDITNTGNLLPPGSSSRCFGIYILRR